MVVVRGCVVAWRATGYVLVIPLGAMISPWGDILWRDWRRRSVSGGFCANFLLGPTDPLLAGITQEAARILDKPYVVTAAANYYFAAASAFLIVLAGTFITERVVVPRLGEYRGDEKPVELKELSAAEKRGPLRS